MPDKGGYEVLSTIPKYKQLSYVLVINITMMTIFHMAFPTHVNFYKCFLRLNYTNQVKLALAQMSLRLGHNI